MKNWWSIRFPPYRRSIFRISLPWTFLAKTLQDVCLGTFVLKGFRCLESKKVVHKNGYQWEVNLWIKVKVLPLYPMFKSQAAFSSCCQSRYVHCSFMKPERVLYRGLNVWLILLALRGDTGWPGEGTWASRSPEALARIRLLSWKWRPITPCSLLVLFVILFFFFCCTAQLVGS